MLCRPGRSRCAAFLRLRGICMRRSDPGKGEPLSVQNSLGGETREGFRTDGLHNRLQRYGSARENALKFRRYLVEQREDKLADALGDCGNCTARSSSILAAWFCPLRSKASARNRRASPARGASSIACRRLWIAGPIWPCLSRASPRLIQALAKSG